MLQNPRAACGRGNPDTAEKDTHAPQSLAGGCHHREGLHPSCLPTIHNYGLVFFSLPRTAVLLVISSTKTPPGRQSSLWEQIPPEPHCGSEKTPLRRGIAPRMLIRVRRDHLGLQGRRSRGRNWLNLLHW